MSKVSNILFLLVFAFSLQALYAEDYGDSCQSKHRAAINELVAKYKRKITVLEITSDQLPSLFSIGTAWKAIVVSMMIGAHADDVVKKIQQENRHNVTVLAPSCVDHDMFETLGRCEHFDIVVVRDIFPLIKVNCSRLVEALLKLGDHVFIEAICPEMAQDLKKRRIQIVSHVEGNTLFLSQRPKAGLDIARFSQKDRSKGSKPRYEVTSNFNKKLFYKKGLDHPIPWIDGINLVTFSMLKGVYPTDAQIRKQIVQMQKVCPDHNDLVIGNILVQGDRLIPIDIYDKRRDADLSHCIGAALKAFRVGNKRLENPDRWISDYYDTV